MQTFMDKKMSPGVPRGMMRYPVELPDFPACPARVAAAAPEKFRDGVARNLERGILEWIGRGFLTAGECGGFALTEKANCSHRAIASDLMEKIAEAFE